MPLWSLKSRPYVPQTLTRVTLVLTELTKGRTFGSSRERLQEQTKEDKNTSLRGRAGQGESVGSACSQNPTPPHPSPSL